MAKDAIVFGCANPVLEIWPWGARIVSNGAQRFPESAQQLARVSWNLSRSAREIALFARERGLTEQAILPRMDDWDAVPRIAAAVGLAAIEQGISDAKATKAELTEKARKTISAAGSLAPRSVDDAARD